MRTIRLAIVGVGNCASALLQGIEYYRNMGEKAHFGLMNREIGGYGPDSIKVVAAFDIDKRKVGQSLEKAAFALPNCTKIFYPNLPNYGVNVSMGHLFDSFSSHMAGYPGSRTYMIADKESSDVEGILRTSRAEILLNYLPVGSEEAARFYAKCCLNTGVSFVNCMPSFIVSDSEWEGMFRRQNIPIVGDDIKSQLGATIVHRTLVKLFEERGVKIDRTYQLNTGGNTDFLNMLNRQRLSSKKISKTEAVQSQLNIPLEEENIHIGPSDYIPWLNDNKVCFLRIEGRGFAEVPLEVELRLSVEDSPNSGGVAIDAIRCCKLARDRGIGGALISVSAYLMKHPPLQFSDTQSKIMMMEFIQGKRER